MSAVEKLMAYMSYHDIEFTVLGEGGCSTPDKYETRAIITRALSGSLRATDYLKELNEDAYDDD